jgi:hypothetical protein
MNGVGAQPVAGCPFASVVLSTAGDLIRVEIEDPNGRRSDRTVASAGSAATIVESWLQEDPTALSTPAAVEEPSPAPVEAAPLPAPTGAPRRRAYFDLDGTAGVGFDGSGWFGGGLAGCAALGPLCLGAGAAVRVDPKVSGDSDELETQRLELDLVALLDVPVRFGGFTLRPGIDLGAAFVRMSKTVPAGSGEEEEQEGDHEGEDEGEDGRSGDGEDWIVQRWELALGAHLKAAIALGKGFALTIGVAVLVLPAADTSSFRGEESSLAGIPRGSVLGSVGLEYAL